MNQLWKSLNERIDLMVLLSCLMINYLIWKYGISNFDDHFLWNLGFALGILLSFLIYVVVYSLSSANHRGEEIARKMTLDLIKYKLALDSASNHIVITDLDGRVIYANQSVEKLTGYSLEEVIGSTPRLWGGQMDKGFYDNFWKIIKTEKKVFSGTLKNKRKNGEIYDAKATVSPIIDTEGELKGFVGIEEDITQALEVERENRESLDKLARFNDLMLDRELKMIELKKELAQLRGKKLQNPKEKSSEK